MSPEFEKSQLVLKAIMWTSMRSFIKKATVSPTLNVICEGTN